MQPQEKIIAWDNQHFEFPTQEMDLGDCVTPNPFFVLSEEENVIVLKLTGQEYLEIVSSLLVGAEWTYPNKSHQILWNFVKAVHCPPTVTGDQECIAYPNIAPFISYFPNNPLSNTVPDGYLLPAWWRFGAFDTIFPDWIDDWIQGQIEAFTGYLETDVLCNIASFPINSIEAFLENGGILPHIEIRFSGVGTVELGMLSFPLGGKAIIELDEYPNVLDILTGGVLDAGAIQLELNRDLFTLPIDEYPLNIVKYPVETTGDHVLYIVFIPTIDDSATPLGLGGGLRSVELCGFEAEETPVGIQSIFWDGCALKQLIDGVESTIVTAEQIQDCLDIPEGGGGGGGAAAISAVTRYNQLSSTINFTNTAYARLVDTEVAYTFTKSKALIGVGCSSSNAGAQSNFFRPLVRQSSVDIQGVDGTEARTFGTTLREVWAWDYFEDLALVNSGIFIDAKVSGSTGAITNNFNLVYVILEFDEIDDLFVQDIRIEGGQLQKKIAGVWVDVSDSFEDIITGLQTDINAAQVTANNAINTANNALATANTAIAVNNTQNTRLTNLEAFRTDAELDIAQHALTLGDHETRIDALEASSGGGGDSPYLDFGVWSQEYTWSDAQISGISPFTLVQGTLSSLGIHSTTSGTKTVSINSPAINNNQVTHIGVKLIRASAIATEISVTLSSGSSDPAVIEILASGIHVLWLRVGNIATGGLNILCESLDGNEFYLYGLQILGRGDNPF